MKTININGIEYVQRSELEALRKEVEQKAFTRDDLNKIKDMVVKSFDEVTSEPTPQRSKERNANVVFSPSITSQRKFTINGVDNNGRFILKRGFRSVYTQDDVKFLKENVNDKTTHVDIRNFAEHLGLRREMIRKLIYNISIGTFDKYI